MSNTEKRQISIEQAASLLGMSPQWVRYMLKRGLIPGIQYAKGGRWVIYKEEVIEYKQRHRNQNAG